MPDSADHMTRLAEALSLFEAFTAGVSGYADEAALLAAHPELVEFLQPMLAEHDPGMTIGAAPGGAPQAGLAVGDRIGVYEVQQEIGVGGMGSVFLVEQHEPIRRRAALKYIKLGMDTAEVIARFELERQTLALMDHACIAKVYDAGTSPQGRPYFVMEYVEGQDLLSWCDARRLSVRARLELFARICDAIQHAHQKGVIHRDLKPSNILVTEQDGQALPKIIDFGIAKAVEGQAELASDLTRSGQVVGTPEYMSPEQARSGGQEADTRTDVYSLGIVLYQLLVDALPFVAKDHSRAGIHALLQEICENEPRRPSSRVQVGGPGAGSLADLRRTGAEALRAELRGELDWIVLRALTKEPDGRYASAAELAADVRRYLADEPIEARPPSTTYRMRKFVRRHRVGVVAAGLVLLSLVAGLVVSTALYFHAEEQRRVAEDNLKVAEAVSSYLVEVFNQAAPAQSLGEAVEVKDLLLPAANSLEQRVPDPLIRARLAEALGQVLMSLGEYQVAERMLHQARELAPAWRQRDPVLASRVRLALANLARDEGDYARGEALYKELADDGPLAGDPGRRLLYLANQASCVAQQGREDDALQLAEEVAQGLADLPEPDETTVRARRALGLVYFRLQDWEQALVHLQATQVALKRLFPRGHPWSAQLSLSLGAAYTRLNRVDAARQEIAVAVQEIERFYGAEHEFAAYPLLAHADLLRRQGQRSKALSFYLDGIARLEQGDRPNRSLLGRRLCNLGVLQRELGKLEDAEESLRRALQHLSSVHANQHVDVAVTQGSLAQVLIDRLELQEAEVLLEAAAKTCRELDAPQLVGILNTRCGLLIKRQRYDAARACSEEALELVGAQPSQAHADALLVRAFIENLQGKPAAALARADAALAMFAELQIDTDPRIANLHYHRGWALQSQRKLDAAIACFRRAIRGFEASVPEGNLLESYAQDMLGSIYFGRGKYAEARPHYERACALRRRLLPERAHFRLTSTNNLAALYHQLGEPEQAVPLIDEVIRLRRAHYPADNTDLATALLWGAQIALAVEQAELARQRIDAARSVYAKSVPAGHWILSMCDSVKGEVLLELGQAPEAMELLEAALPSFPERSPHHRQTLKRLVRGAEALGDEARAARYRGRLER